MTAPTLRDRLAALVHGIEYATLPAEVIYEAKRLLLDTLGCALGGYHGAPCHGVRQLVRELGGRPEATVIGSGDRTSCPLATLANGTMLRYLDANDYYFGRDPAHASGNIAAALAVAERQGLSGREAILGMVVGYEVQHRLCDFAGRPNLWQRGWHHATNMQFASAALAARLLGLDAAGIAEALAIAGTHNNTLTESMRGHMASIKASIEATTAKAGVEAALMARHGLTGPAAIFEGDFGWVKVVAAELDAEGLTRPIAGHYRILDACMKPYAAQALNQGQIHAAITLHHRHRPDPASIARIEGFFPEQIMRQPSMDASKLAIPRNREMADHSPPYLMVISLLEGACGPAQFTLDKIQSPIVQQLLSKVTLHTDDRLTPLWPGANAGAVVVTLHDGTRLEAVCDYPPGHPRHRLSDAEVEAKFFTYAYEMMEKPQAERLIEALWRLETFDSLQDFTRLLSLGLN